MKKILAIVPARGGSKGLPDKNILPLAGHPLIAYSIKAALDSPSINRVIVSTDSEKIANIARTYGAEVPFMRPAEYADDYSLDYDVFRHALTWLQEHENYRPDLVVQLRPTSPIRYVKDIETCIERMDIYPEADSIRVITPSHYTPYKMWRAFTEERPMTPLMTMSGMKEAYNQPRQSLPTIYWQVGTLDVIRPEVILEQGNMSGDAIFPYRIEPEQAIDIDDIYSFQRAEAYLLAHDCIKF